MVYIGEVSITKMNISILKKKDREATTDYTT